MDQSMFLIFFTAAMVNNLILTNFLGLCPFFGVSKQKEAALGMSFAVLFVMIMTVIITWPLFKLLVFLDLKYLQTLSFILVIASMVQLAEKAIKKLSPVLYDQLGIFLPLITTNCAVLGVAFLATQPDVNYSYSEALVYACGSAVGWGFVLILFAFIRERLALYKIPRIFEGLPIAFITAGLMAIGFMGFIGMFK
ncbi:MAG: RnfABCDGE type electron transport complex subunit A [Planctomycetes bacterium]|nr:RnfABCDGE type electron transport complex subunit A [Planctomycetota bacterium]